MHFFLLHKYSHLPQANNLTENNSGGIHLSNSRCKIRNTLIVNNEFHGLYLKNGSDAEFINVTIANNEWGGYAIDSDPYFRNVIIRDNGIGHGFMFFTDSNPILENVNIFNNEADVKGGGICSISSSTFTFLNSILWGNIGTWHGNEVHFLGYNGFDIMHSYFSDIDTSEIVLHDDNNYIGFIELLDGNIIDDPLFNSSNNYNLQSNSPCIDTGTDFLVYDGDTLVNYSAVDYVGSTPDMGAFEFGSVSIDEEMNTIPSNFILHPNYPNPFNPTTTIRFSVGNTDLYSLQVYDITGHLVESLMEDELNPRRYEIKWYAKDNPSGVYFVKLITGEKTQSKIMVLIK